MPNRKKVEKNGKRRNNYYSNNRIYHRNNLSANWFDLWRSTILLEKRCSTISKTWQAPDILFNCSICNQLDNQTNASDLNEKSLIELINKAIFNLKLIEF